MGRHKLQSGSVHLIAVVILIVATVGALGLVYWQNAAKSNILLVDKIATKKSTSNTIINRTLTIPEWGVRGIYSSSSILNYEIMASGNVLSFSSEKLSQCGSIESITRINGDMLLKDTDEYRYNDKISNTITVSQQYPMDNINGIITGNKHVGDYYYVYSVPAEGCYPDDSEAVNLDYLMMINNAHQFFRSLEAI